MIVYKITNNFNKKSYIGITKNLKNRWGNHLNKANTKMLFARIVNEVGKENFTIQKIDYANNKKEALKKEKYWIKKENTLYPNGYNLPLYTHDMSKEVFCLTNNTKYKSIKNASNLLSLDPSSISKCCKGKLKQVKGYHFEYADIDNKIQVDKNWLFSKTSKYKGVHLDKKRNKWVSSIHPNRTTIFLGCYDDEELAHLIYLMACEVYYAK